MSEALRLAREAQDVFKAAEAKGGPLTDAERVHVEGLLTRADDHKTLETKMAKLSQQLGPPAPLLEPGSFGGQGPRRHLRQLQGL